jgi:tetratricopeptide (TPR) repeat protein
MAERMEEPEAEASPGGAVAADGGVATGIALALGEARPGAQLPPEAAEFLKRQSRLVGLQMEHLHEQRELVLSRLRWGRFSDRVKAALQVMTAVIGLAVAVAIGAMAWNAHADHGVRIEAFSVPPELAQKGLTGQVVASQLLDKLADMQAKTVTNRPASSYADDWGGDIKVEIPETGVSIGELNRYLRDWLGSETRISGEVVRTAKGLAVTARAGAKPGATFEGPDADLDKLMQQAAEAVYDQTQPYRYAAFLSSSNRNADAATAYQRLTRSGASEDRAWAYAGLAFALIKDNKYLEAIDAGRNAVAIDDRQQQGWGALGTAYGSLGRLEEALQASHRITENLKAGRTRGVAGNLADAMRTAAGIEALVRSDPQAAAALLTQDTYVAEGAAGNIPGMRAQALAGDHDVTGARRAAAAAGASDLGEILQGGDLAMLDEWRAAAAVRDRLRAKQGSSFALSPSNVAGAAGSYALAGRMAEAEALLSNTPPDCNPCLVNRGLVASLKHDWPAADRWFAEAARQAPSFPNAHTEWGRALLEKGDLDGAIAKFAAAHQITPHFADPIELWGEALMRKGDHAGAGAKFAEADQYAPKWGRNHMRWGEALMLQGRYREAHQQYEAADRLDLSRADHAALDVLLARTAKGSLHG